MRLEQVLAVALDALERLARARRELLLGRRRAADRRSPRMAHSGVRSSWLIDARNSVFTLLARVSRSPCSVSAMLFSRSRSCVQALCSATASWRAASRTPSAASLGAAGGSRRGPSRPRPRRRARWGTRAPSAAARVPMPRSSVGSGSPRASARRKTGSRLSITLLGRPSAPKAVWSIARPSVAVACTGTRRSASSSR